jgi:hypothetical protein
MLWWSLVAALAQDGLSYDAVNVVEHGKTTPSVTFHPATSGTLTVNGTCSGKAFSLSSAMSKGKDLVLPLPGLSQGVHDCSFNLAIRTTDGTTGDMAFDLQVVSLGLLQVQATLDDYDRNAGTLRVHLDRDAASVSAAVYGARGALIATPSVDLSDSRNPKLAWNANGQEVVKIEVQATDAYGFGSVLELLPWFYAVPHEDVIFASAQADVIAAEVPKLERSWAEISHALELYGAIVPIRLYVAGYTDTVSDPAYNRVLSEKRARAIAAWFRTRGFAGPIFYQGFGEDVLAVPTADSVDEAANRRAVYVLAAEAPPASKDIPTAAWKKL